MSQFVTVTQVAAASGYSSKTIQRALEDGELRGARRGTRGHWRIDVGSAERFLARCNARLPKPLQRVTRRKRRL